MTTPRSNHNPARVRLIAVCGALLCAVLAPLQSAVWNGPAAPAWVGAVAGLLQPGLRGVAAASAMAQPSADYFFYGRFFILVYASLLFTLRRLPFASALLFGFVAIAAAGDFAAYWVSAVAGPAVRRFGFWDVEVPALAGGLIVASMVGVRGLRRGTMPWSAALAFAAVAPLALVTTAALRYMPHGLVLPLALALVAHAYATPGVALGAHTARGPGGWRRRLFVAGTGVGAALVAVVLVLLPYRPVVVAGEAAPHGPFTLPRPVSGLRLHVFNTGMNRMSAVLVGAERPWRPAPAFVIEHPTHGLVVFDCGLSEAVARDGEAALPIPLRWLFESRGRPGRTLDAQMRKSGFDPGVVPLVVISHLHDDHVGVVAAFRAAQFIGGAGTRAHFADLASRWREIGPSDATRPLPPFAGALDLFGDGSVEVIPGGGHTHEDLMLLLALPEGPVLLTGDAVVHRDWLAGDDVQRIAVDGERAAAVRNEIRALVAADPRLVLFPGHDLGAAPRDRSDVVLHHAEWFSADAWPVSP